MSVVALVAAALVGSALAVPSASPRLVPIVRGLSSPVLATQAPGEPGRIYVVEQGGRVRIVKGGRVRSTFLDVRRLVVAGGEQGLLGLAFPPDYRRTRRIFVNFSTRADGATVVARYRAAAGRAVPGTRTTLLRVAQPYANHNGGNLAFGPDGRLWVGLGDGGSAGDPENRAQNPATLLGKLFRLDVRRNRPTPELVGIGLRNPWRYSFDRATGDLWIGDVGQGIWEEVDVARAGIGGLDFGWDRMEGAHCFEPASGCDQAGLVLPVAEYGRADGCTIIGGNVYRGSAQPLLAGGYLFADHCSGRLWAISASEDGPVEPVRVGTAGPGVAGFGEDEAGEVYAANLDGTISLIVATSR